MSLLQGFTRIRTCYEQGFPSARTASSIVMNIDLFESSRVKKFVFRTRVGHLPTTTSYACGNAAAELVAIRSLPCLLAIYSDFSGFSPSWKSSFSGLLL